MSHERAVKSRTLRAFCAFIRTCAPLLAGIALPGLIAIKAEAAEFSLRPGVTVSEEYNDNIYLTSADEVHDYETRVMPSLNLNYRTGFWSWDALYSYDYRHYAKGSRNDEATHAAEVRNRTELLNNLLIVEIGDQYSRVSLDATRDYTQESSFVNQSERNVFTFHPHFHPKSGEPGAATIGYIYQNTWYKDPSGVNTVSNVGYAETITPLSSRATFTTGARFTRQESDPLSFDQTDLYAGPKYVYGRNSSLHLVAGHSWFNFEEGRRVAQGFWSAGLTHQHSIVTASIETGLRYIPDPVRVLRREDHVSATTRIDTGRTAVAISGSVADYRDPETKHLESTVTQLGGTLRYALTPRTTFLLDLSKEWLKDYQASTYQALSFRGVRFERRVTEQITLAVAYRYSGSRSPDLSVVEYDNNRVLFEITGRF